MSFVSTVLIAFAMSTDAFAAALGKGAALARPRFSEALRTGIVFGVIETVTPMVGWGLGVAAARHIVSWDHWLAFFLLLLLGLRMIHAGLSRPKVEVEKPQRHALGVLMLTGVATSIDAMAVGASLALIHVPIVPVALAIGLATLVMATLGVMLGRALGVVAGRRAEVLGGLILIGIGSLILYEHLSHPGAGVGLTLAGRVLAGHP